MMINKSYTIDTWRMPNIELTVSHRKTYSVIHWDNPFNSEVADLAICNESLDADYI